MTIYCVDPERVLQEAPVTALGWYSEEYRTWAQKFCDDQYGSDWYSDGLLEGAFVEWKRRVRRRIEERIRKDPDALFACAIALRGTFSID